MDRAPYPLRPLQPGTPRQESPPPVLAAKIASPKTKARQSLPSSLPPHNPRATTKHGLGYVCIGPVLTSSQTSINPISILSSLILRLRERRKPWRQDVGRLQGTFVLPRCFTFLRPKDVVVVNSMASVFCLQIQRNSIALAKPSTAAYPFAYLLRLALFGARRMTQLKLTRWSLHTEPFRPPR